MNKTIKQAERYEAPEINVHAIAMKTVIATSLDQASLGADATFNDESEF